jgi:hypothetical protein
VFWKADFVVVFLASAKETAVKASNENKTGAFIDYEFVG